MMGALLFSVNGIMHRPKKIVKMVAEDVDTDDVLELEREPTNEYDSDAVKVFFDGEWIGYVEREASEEIAKIIESGVDYECKVISCFSEWDTDITDSGREIEFVTDIDLLAEIIIL